MAKGYRVKHFNKPQEPFLTFMVLEDTPARMVVEINNTHDLDDKSIGILLKMGFVYDYQRGGLVFVLSRPLMGVDQVIDDLVKEFSRRFHGRQ